MTPVAAVGGAVAGVLTDAAGVAGRVAGLAVLAGVVAAVVAAGYRWYTRQRVPGGLTALTGLAAVAVLLNATAALRLVVGGETDPLALSAVAFNGLGFVAAWLATAVGRRVGDGLAIDGVAYAGGTGIDGEVSQLVRAVGRVVAVELPREVEDIEGYDPVPDDVKASLAGKTLLFPRRLTVAELRERLVARLEDDYGVGYVDVDLDAEGTVDYLAVGRRVAGIGPTLPPGDAAVAVRADPPNAASPGDLVQVFDPDSRRRVATAELRATAGDVVTLACDAADAPALAGGDYRLVTLPTEPRAEREFAGLLRAADETMAAVPVREGGDLAGLPLGSLDATVLAVRSPDAPVEAIPSRDRVLAVGDVLYVLARPDALRRVEAAAGGTGDPPG